MVFLNDFIFLTNSILNHGYSRHFPDDGLFRAMPQPSVVNRIWRQVYIGFYFLIGIKIDSELLNGDEVGLCWSDL
jgi:hypothetical protein